MSPRLTGAPASRKAVRQRGACYMPYLSPPASRLLSVCIRTTLCIALCPGSATRLAGGAASDDFPSTRPSRHLVSRRLSAGFYLHKGTAAAWLRNGTFSLAVWFQQSQQNALCGPRNWAQRAQDIEKGLLIKFLKQRLQHLITRSKSLSLLG